MNIPTFNGQKLELTGRFSADEEGEDKERIVEGYANILWAIGFETDGSVDTACPSSNICSHKVVYVFSVPFLKPIAL